jgi:PAS domain S-box-containing protein
MNRNWLQFHRNILFLALVLPLCLGTVIPFAAAQNTEVRNLEKVSLQLKWKHQFQFAGFYAALEKGFYQEAGLDVTLIEGGPDIDFIGTVVSGDAQYGVEMPDLLLRRVQGDPVVVLACIYQHSPIALMSLSESGIRSPHDLIGRKIMLRPASNADLRAMLSNEGIEEGAVSVMDHSFNFDDLLQGKTDAMSLYSTAYASEFKSRGIAFHSLSPYSYGVDFYGDCLFTSEKEIDRHPERVEKFRSASLKGWEYAMNNPTEIAQLIHEKYAPDKSIEALVFEAEQMAPLLLHHVIEIGHINPGRWTHIADTFVRQGMLEANYTLEGFIYSPSPTSFNWWFYVGFGLLGGALLVGGVANVWNRRLHIAVVQRTLALKKSEERFRDLVETTSDWIWEVDVDGFFTYSSPQAESILGYSPEELKHKTAFDLIADDKVEEIRAVYEKLVAASAPMTAMENVNLHKDGTRVVLESTGIPIFDESGKLKGYRGIDRDITERKKAEQERQLLETQMQQTQKLESLGVMAGGIAHDFNNILFAILGNADLALDEMPLEAIGREFLHEIQTAARRASGLTDQMLAYSGKGALAVENIDLSDLVHEMAHLLEVSHTKRALVKYDFKEHLPLIEGDPSQLRQIVMNLITNASEAIGDEGGIITVETGAIEATQEYLATTYANDELPGGCYVYLKVTDTGCGMDEQGKSRIFEPFFTTKFTGRGLGMAAVLGIVRSHRGAIDIQSDVGQGTAIATLFPALDETARPLAEESRGDDEWVGHGTILVVDDEPQIVDLIKRILERKGFTILTAEDGRQAIDTFRKFSDDIVCVVLDLTMPNLGGDEAFIQMRAIREGVKAVLVSGYSEEQLKERVENLGFAGFLKKPVQSRELLEKVRATLEV